MRKNHYVRVPCSLCEGTGKRNTGVTHFTCHRCDGYGEVLKPKKERDSFGWALFGWVMLGLSVGVAAGIVFGGCEVPSKAPMLCDEFIQDDYCAKVVTCGLATRAECVSQVTTALDCGSYTSVDESKLSRCKNDLLLETCDTFAGGTQIVLPASCNGVFLK